MTKHHLQPEAGILHGYFSRDLPPVLTINPGDTVTYRTLDARWGTEPPPSAYEFGRQFQPRGENDKGHAMCGPIHINGAKPGMMLAIHVQRIVPGAWGWTLPWFEPLGGGGSGIPLLIWSLDTNAMTATDQHGHRVKLKPFMGVMGMPPAEGGIHSTTPPRRTGGNIDCKELVAGSTLYLPIDVEGGLFSVGDGHATQGDGESGGCAIECPMDEVELTFDLVENPPIPTAHAHTPAGKIAFGFDLDLGKAATAAMNALIDWMVADDGIPRLDALSLAGVVADLRVTQLVNESCGAHAVLPHDAFVTK